ncbi:membrane protein [Salmonella enterica subsp. enterica]|nr:membrane protein [Salmonella enterica subsp. enterica]
MTLPFKPHLIALVCSAGLFAASGVLYVKSRAPEAPAQAAAPAPEQTQTAVPAPVAKTTFTTAQIDQWVAPVALYPDALLSQVLMASTYPANVVQAVQWSRDNPRCRAMPLFRRWPANRGTPASNRWSPFPS